MATAEEAFDWMAGPLSDGLFPDELYNGLEMPQDKRGYVMSYNKVVGKVRLRQLRVKRDGCKLSESVFQSGTLRDGTARQRQLIDYCFPQYTLPTKSEESFGPEELQEPSCTCTHAHAHARACHAHAMHMPCTCHAHAMHMPCTCHAHAMHMPCTCHAHAMHTHVHTRTPASAAA